MQILDKDIINKEILVYLSTGKRGFEIQVPTYQIVEAILYKLKTGCQWKLLPINQFFREHDYSWQSVYHHYSKWSKDGSWKRLWNNVLRNHKNILDLSSIQIDGSHTPAKKGGEAVSYQGRKKSKTSNMIFLSDNAGNMLVFSDVYGGSHHDLYQIKDNFEKMFTSLKEANIPIDGLFLNADAGFDNENLRKLCFTNDIFANIDLNKRNGQLDDYQTYDTVFDKELYKNRFIIERANAWFDSFRTILTRFTVKAKN